MPAQPARFQARFWGQRQQAFDSTPIRLDLFLNGWYLATRSWLGGAPQVIDTTGIWLVEGANRLSMNVARPPGASTVHEANLLACDLVFDRRLLAVGDTLEFIGPDTAGDLAYDVAPFSDAAGLTLLDVSDPLRPVELTGWAAADTMGGRALRFHDVRRERGSAAAPPAVTALPTRREHGRRRLPRDLLG
jgi:hypothetical protein